MTRTKRQKAIPTDGPEQTRLESAEPQTVYVGSKWGAYLRAPNAFFVIKGRGIQRGSIVLVADVADVWNGIKSGADEFFLPYDATARRLDSMTSEEMQAEFGITRRQTRTLHVVEVKKRPFVIEARFLQPILFRLTDLDELTVRPERMRRVLVHLEQPKRDLAGTSAANYIREGERQGFHRREDCRRREPWYAVPIGAPGPIVWSISQQYRHLIGWNPHHVLANHNFFYLARRDGEQALLCAILNSTVVGLFKEFYGRPSGREGAIKTEGMDIRRTLIPDPRRAAGDQQVRILRSFERLLRRHYASGQWLTEQFAWDERRELDDAVLELVGFTDPGERVRVRSELYDAIDRVYKARREVELKAQRNRTGGGRRARPTARSLAEELWLRLPKSEHRAYPRDFIPDGTAVETITVDGPVVVGTHLMTHGPFIATGAVRVGDKVIDFGSESRATFLGRAARAHEGESVPVPLDADLCARLLREHDQYLQAIRADLKERAAVITADEVLQQAIVEHLIDRIARIG